MYGTQPQQVLELLQEDHYDATRPDFASTCSRRLPSRQLSHIALHRQRKPTIEASEDAVSPRRPQSEGVASSLSPDTARQHQRGAKRWSGEEGLLRHFRTGRTRSLGPFFHPAIKSNQPSKSNQPQCSVQVSGHTAWRTEADPGAACDKPQPTNGSKKQRGVP
jgi:hypothetical protein